MSSIDEYSAAIGAAAESVGTVAAAIVAAKDAGDGLADRFSGVGAEDKADGSSAVNQRLDGEAAATAARLKSLLEEVQQQAEALRGLQDGGTSPRSIPDSPAPTTPDSSSRPTAPRKFDGRTYSIHAQERMGDPTRNVSAPEIERAIANGKSRPGKKPGTIDYYDPEVNINVVTNTAGDVVTVWRQSRTPVWAR